MSTTPQTTSESAEAEPRKYVEEVGSTGAITLEPRPQPPPTPPQSPVLDDIGRIWDPARFTVLREPISVGPLRDRTRFSRLPTPRVSNVPVKFPGSDYRIPAEVACAVEALQLCIDCEHAINPDVDAYYAYLTVDRDVIPEGWAQRGLGVHADFLQGQRVSPKRAGDHGYLCTDRDPPVFYRQPFELTAEDVANDAFNSAFERQAQAQFAAPVAPYEVVLFDSYCVHGAVPAARTARRTFIRFFYSLAVYDRFGDTHNALFDYRWKMDYRPRP